MATEESRGSHAPSSGTTPGEPPVAGTNPPGAEEIRNQVERIVGSLGFPHEESLVVCCRQSLRRPWRDGAAT
jgi:hypothetical protein